MTASIISVAKLSKTYATGFRALADVDLEIRRGEIFALLGPNGAGKTTLISIVCGIVNATSGSVRVDGHDIVADYRAARSMIGLVPQELTTDAFETPWGAVSFSRGLFGKSANPAHIEKVLKDLSLWDRRDSRIMTLSGGMKRRVMIAKALAHEPEILFLDEPTVGMDVEARRAFVASIQTLAAAGKTIVFTSHYLREAEELAGRIVVIDRGTVIADASPRELKARVPGKKITVVAGRPLARADLDGLPASVMSLDGDRASLLSNEPAAVLRELFRRGVDVVDLEVSGADLEEAFLALTRRPEVAG